MGMLVRKFDSSLQVVQLKRECMRKPLHARSRTLHSGLLHVNANLALPVTHINTSKRSFALESTSTSPAPIPRSLTQQHHIQVAHNRARLTSDTVLQRYPTAARPEQKHLDWTIARRHSTPSLAQPLKVQNLWTTTVLPKSDHLRHACNQHTDKTSRSARLLANPLVRQMYPPHLAASRVV